MGWPRRAGEIKACEDMGWRGSIVLASKVLTDALGEACGQPIQGGIEGHFKL